MAHCVKAIPTFTNTIIILNLRHILVSHISIIFIHRKRQMAEAKIVQCPILSFWLHSKVNSISLRGWYLLIMPSWFYICSLSFLLSVSMAKKVAMLSSFILFIYSAILLVNRYIWFVSTAVLMLLSRQGWMSYHFSLLHFSLIVYNSNCLNSRTLRTSP